MSEANEQTYQIIADLIKQGDAEEALVKLEQLLIKVPNDLTALSMSGLSLIHI